MSYIRKTKDEFRIYVHYGDGWEHDTTEDTYPKLKLQMVAYRENCGYPVKWKRVRVPVDDSIEATA
jgi:hypothetical protein